MSGRWWLVSIVAGALVAGQARPAPAEKPELAGGEVKEILRPANGFVDDPFAIDGGGGRLLYLTSTPEGAVSAVLYDLSQHARLLSVPIDRWIKRPVYVAFGDDRLVVVGLEDDKRERAVVIDRRGKVARKLGPATRIRVAEYEGTLVAAIYNRRPGRGGTTVHQVEARSLATGRRINRRGSLVLDASGRDKKRELVVNHWRSEHLIAVGVKDGVYDRGEDQRMPDFNVHWDMTRAAVVKRTEIKDLLKHRRRQLELATHSNKDRFITASRDRKLLTATSPEGKREVKLAEALDHYDPDTLVFHEHGDKLYFSMQIDPVHPDAARKRLAVRPWLDLYELADGATRAVRKARLMPEKSRKLRWRAAPDVWVVAPAHRGFDRGGPELIVIGL